MQYAPTCHEFTKALLCARELCKGIRSMLLHAFQIEADLEQV